LKLSERRSWIWTVSKLDLNISVGILKSINVEIDLSGAPSEIERLAGRI
jgi:hypothetical protein